MKTLIQLLAAFFGTLGFSMVLNVDRKHIIFPSAGGAVCWAFFLLLRHFGLSIFASTFCSATLIGICGEIFAHKFKEPTTVFFIPSCVPLIPGSNLYYALEGLINRNTSVFTENALLFVFYALGIAAGLAVVIELDYMRNKIMDEIRR